MKKIKEIFKQKKPTFSFELFPPKTEQGFQNLLETIRALAGLRPDFISCTYGAGGGSREKTLDVIQHIQDKHTIPGLAHLTCVLHTKDEIKSILENMRARGIQNVLALRGDPPQDDPHWQPAKDNFRYSSELCAFIRRHFKDHFSIGVAGFPEGHLLCPDRDQDAGYLKLKIDNGADFVITQLFFDNKDYFTYVERLKKLGVNVPIVPGILPITNYKSLVKFCAVCGARISEKARKTFEPIQDDPEATLKEGIRFAVQQCQDLLKGGAPGVHFYCLNKASPSDQILSALKSKTDSL